jgi:hypothetical protein
MNPICVICDEGIPADDGKYRKSRLLPMHEICRDIHLVGVRELYYAEVRMEQEKLEKQRAAK